MNVVFYTFAGNFINFMSAKGVDVKQIFMTKKTIFNGILIALVLTFCASFNSCQKEGVYDPKQKISKIYTDVNYSEDEVYPKQLVQEWTWNGNKLDKVDSYGISFSWEDDNLVVGSEIYATDHYFYEKNRVVKIEHEDIEEHEKSYTKFSYDGSKYKKMELLDNNQNLVSSTDFQYQNGKISTMTTGLKMDIGLYKNLEIRLLSTMLPKEYVPVIAKKLKEYRQSKSETSINLIVNYTYNGDNVKEIGVDVEVFGTKTNMLTALYVAYDNKQNPLYHKMDINGLAALSSFGIMIVTSKNNPLEVQSTSKLISEATGSTTYSYPSYFKDFPLEVIEKSTFGEFSIKTKLYYEYK